MSLDAGPYPKDVKQCSSCEADIVFLRTRKRKWIPVNVVPTRSEFRGPTPGEVKFVFGQHQAHFTTCTDPQPVKVYE